MSNPLLLPTAAGPVAINYRHAIFRRLSPAALTLFDRLVDGWTLRVTSVEGKRKQFALVQGAVVLAQDPTMLPAFRALQVRRFLKLAAANPGTDYFTWTLPSVPLYEQYPPGTALSGLKRRRMRRTLARQIAAALRAETMPSHDMRSAAISTGHVTKGHTLRHLPRGPIAQRTHRLTIRWTPATSAALSQWAHRLRLVPAELVREMIRYACEHGEQFEEWQATAKRNRLAATVAAIEASKREAPAPLNFRRKKEQ